VNDDAALEQALALARHHIDTGRPERALAVLAEHGELATSLDAWFLRALALFRLERHREAVAAAERGLAVEPEAPGLLHLAGAAHVQLGDHAAAERCYLGALRLDPEEPSTLCAYARLCALGGQLDKARRLVAVAASLDPGSVAVLRVRWTIAHLSGDKRGEAELSRQLLAAAPEDAGAHVLASIGQDPRRAARSLRTAARLDPGDRDNVAAARQARAGAHWLLWPIWPILRLGQVGSWLVAVGTMYALKTLVSPRAAGIFALAWIAMCVYSWVVPPLLLRWYRRS
jgi:tetratricopeptide (TPR) repeat protein